MLNLQIGIDVFITASSELSSDEITLNFLNEDIYKVYSEQVPRLLEDPDCRDVFYSVKIFGKNSLKIITSPNFCRCLVASSIQEWFTSQGYKACLEIYPAFEQN